MGLSRRTKSILLLVVVVLLINLPIVSSIASGYRLEREGVDLTAPLVDSSTSGSGASASYVLSARLPADLDPEETVVSARVSRAAYDEALASQRVDLRVNPDRPALSYRFDGQVRSRTGLWLTVGADLLLVLVVLLLVRTPRYGRRRHDLRLEAVGDIVDADDVYGIVDDDEEGRVRVTGQLLDVTDHEILLDLGDRMAWVVLDGHACPVPVGHDATARGRLLAD